MAKTLPGIGDETAPKIVNGRPYASPQDLVTKGIVTDAQFGEDQGPGHLLTRFVMRYGVAAACRGAVALRLGSALDGAGDARV